MARSRLSLCDISSTAYKLRRLNSSTKMQANYDELLSKAKGSAKYWIPKLCEALRKENPQYSNDDIRERVKKDCIETWQRDTITDALPDEYKNKLRQEIGRRGRQKQLEQRGSTVTITETDGLPDSNQAKYGSESPTGQGSSTSTSTPSRPVITPEEGARVNEMTDIKRQLDETNQQLLEDWVSSGRKIEKETGTKRDLKLSDSQRKIFARMIDRTNDRIQNDIERNGRLAFRILAVTFKGLYLPIFLRMDRRKGKVWFSLDEKYFAN